MFYVGSLLFSVKLYYISCHYWGPRGYLINVFIDIIMLFNANDFVKLANFDVDQHQDDSWR